MATPCEMPAGVGGFISFHIAAKTQYFTMCGSTLFHIRRKANISLEKTNKLCYNGPWKGGGEMAESKLRSLSTDFAVQIVKLCEGIKGHYSLVNQLERSATSVGANIHEANYAQSKADFVSKLQISLKECYETEYWLEIFVKSDLMTRDDAKELYNQCGMIRRMLISSINTAKENACEKINS